MFDVAIIGGGAAGFFAAVNIKAKHPQYKVIIIEKNSTVLNKVRVSGGGRCNVTHHCFDPYQLVKYYPRGQRELLSVFTRFNPENTIAWFKSHGVPLKTELDGRMFPVTDDSETIINCLLNLSEKYKVEIKNRMGVKAIHVKEQSFELETESGIVTAHKLLIAGGSSDSLWQMISGLGHKIISPVPSLFTFNIKNQLLEDLMGISFVNAQVELDIEKPVFKTFNLKKNDLIQVGPMLITHWGLSGPAILKLSSVAAVLLHHLNYRFQIKVNFISQTIESVLDEMQKLKKTEPKKQIINTPLFGLPQRFWHRLHSMSFQHAEIKWADVSNNELNVLANLICNSRLPVMGKSTFKEEFVTAGGVDLKEIDFKTMESKLVKNLYFAGEVINVDALTGGFNFQAAWSEAWIVSESI